MRTKNAEMKWKFFFWFYGILNFFFGFSGLDMGIARIASPSSQERSEDENQECRDETKIYASVYLFFCGGSILGRIVALIENDCQKI